MNLHRINSPAVIAGLLIIVATAAAYRGSFAGPFILDDGDAILRNPTIRSLHPIWQPLLPPCDGSAVDRRPVTNFSLALNYAWGETAVGGYHAFNFTAHVLAAIVLFWIVRDTLSLPAFSDRFGRSATVLAAATAVLWATHPLQTNAVTYVVQRTEVLAGLFSFLAVACLQRAAADPARTRWQAGAVTAAFLALGSKESSAALPVFLFAYDAVLLAGSWRAALARRGTLHALVAAALLVPAGYLLRDRLVGAPPPSVSFMARDLRLDYLLSQFDAICLYVRLALWPAPLVLDYGPPSPTTLAGVALQASLVMLAIGGTAFALVRGRPIGLVGLLFFGALAPSSLMPIVPEWAAEKRMYVALVAIALPATLAVHKAGSRLLERLLPAAGPPARGWIGAAACLPLVFGLVAASERRNRDYRTELSIWADSVAKRPDNPRAQSNLGLFLEEAGRPDEAREHYRRALELEPDSPIPLTNLAGIQLQSGDAKMACRNYARVVALLPTHARARVNLGRALLADGRAAEAVVELQQVVVARPDFVGARVELAKALTRAGRTHDGIRELQAALQIAPGDGELSAALGLLLARQDRVAEAIPHFAAAARALPDDPQIHMNLGLALMATDQVALAVAEYRRALALAPGFALAMVNLGDALVALDEPEEAIALYRRAEPLLPHDQALLRSLAWLLATRDDGDPAEAIRLAAKACELEPRNDPLALDTLAAAYASAGRYPEAVTIAERAVAGLVNHPQRDRRADVEARLEGYRHGRPYRAP